ncbi:MAG: hypothetical protein MJ158_00020 [Alphaproteobacteria bacterium]|nr:hypothetical protein [Alphaproteobacteria bacterium]
MKYIQILEKEIKKTEKEQDEFLKVQECNEYRLGYEDGLRFALQKYKEQSKQRKSNERL